MNPSKLNQSDSMKATISSCPVFTLMLVAAAGLALQGAQFEEVTQSAGVTNSAGYCMGVAWGDYDNDGHVDLYVAGGGPGVNLNRLYRNRGDGTFALVGAEAGPIVTDNHSSFGCAWVDFNNDGYRDLMVVNGGWSAARNDCYLNLGDGTFGALGVGELTARSRVRSWQAFADVDGDGWVDLYSTEAASASGPFYPRLYRPTPYGTFVPSDLGPSVAYLNDGVWGDYDNDGDPDLFQSNFSSRSGLWRNEGEGRFTELDTELSSSGSALHAAWADYDHDGDLDIAVGSYGGVTLYRNDGAAVFTWAAGFSGNYALPAWADYDNDGHPDLVAVGGQGSPARAGLFRNAGDGTFEPVNDLITEEADQRLGCAWGDYDNDGFPELVIAQELGRNRLYRNRTNDHHWIKFQLVGTAANRDAIGAKVHVTATLAGQPVTQLQEVNGGYQIQNDTRLNFGLGTATNVGRVRIEWPSGNVQELTEVAADQIFKVTEVAGINPARPSASLNGSVTLTRPLFAGAAYQWRFNGRDLVGQTNRTLNLTQLTTEEQGRYSVVTSDATLSTTNSVYLRIDTHFRKVTEDPVVTDAVKTWTGHFGDYDGDGWLDLAVLGDYHAAGKNTRLYRNDGQGHFQAVTSSPWNTLTNQATYGPWADIDNDGDLDLLTGVNEANPALCLENTGPGGFLAHLIDNTWFQPEQACRGWALACADFDENGLLDFILGGSLSRNNGDGTFTRLAILPNTAHSFQWVDYDDDGDLDLFAPYEHSTSRLYRNEGEGNFTDVTSTVLQSRIGGGLGGAFADFDNDGDLDFHWVGLDSPERFLINDGKGTFSDWSGFPRGLLNLNHGMPAWGDFDNDGWLDLFVAQNAGRCRFFRNLGGGNLFEVVLGSPANDLLGAAQSAAWADYNNDGALDLFVAGNSTRNALYQNVGNGNRWLKVRLTGSRSNRQAVGAKVFATATVDGQVLTQRRQISADSVLQETEAHFGLGTAAAVSRLRIEWPSRIVQEFTNVVPNRILSVIEPRLTGAGVAGGGFQLEVTCDTNRPYALDVSTTLATWQNVAVFTNGSAVYVAPTTPDTARFYRLR